MFQEIPRWDYILQEYGFGKTPPCNAIVPEGWRYNTFQPPAIWFRDASRDALMKIPNVGRKSIEGLERWLGRTLPKFSSDPPPPDLNEEHRRMAESLAQSGFIVRLQQREWEWVFSPHCPQGLGRLITL